MNIHLLTAKPVDYYFGADGLGGGGRGIDGGGA